MPSSENETLEACAHLEAAKDEIVKLRSEIV